MYQTLPPRLGYSTAVFRIKKSIAQQHTTARAYPEIVEAITYYNSTPPEGLDVLVYGGSATSSWAAHHAWTAGKARRILWMCRRGIDAISTEGNPVGRNSYVIQMAVRNNWIQAGEVKNIALNLGALPHEPRLMVELDCLGVDPNKMKRTVQNGQVTLTKAPRPDLNQRTIASFHQIVYAVGSNPMGEGGPGNILSTQLRGELLPYYAKDYQFLTKSEEILLAYATADEKLWVVGAGVFGGAGALKAAALKDKYKKVGMFLTHSGTPPEGIAILSTTIDALTGHMTKDPARFDWNRARPDEMANLFREVYNLDDFYSKMIAKVLVDKRSDSKFALPRTAIEKAVADVNQVYGTTMKIELLQLDKVFR